MIKEQRANSIAVSEADLLSMCVLHTPSTIICVFSIVFIISLCGQQDERIRAERRPELGGGGGGGRIPAEPRRESGIYRPSETRNFTPKVSSFLPEDPKVSGMAIDSLQNGTRFPKNF